MRRNRLGSQLKSARKERRLTLADVGAALGLANGNFIGMVERGERMPSDERLLQLADILELDGRELMALKYAATRQEAAEVLLAPPEPELPRMRKLMLGSCDNATAMRAEFERGERTALERVVWRALLEYVVLPAFDADRYAPRRLRDRVQRERKKKPVDALDAWWFEEEAESFVPWALGQFQGWRFDLPTLTLHIRHSDSPSDVSSIPLMDRELRARMLQAVVPEPKAPTLAELLRAEGLSDGDVDEILDLVEFKKMRASRAG
jgi:transcriptional regulator with XRE-family HTH domain